MSICKKKYRKFAFGRLLLFMSLLFWGRAFAANVTITMPSSGSISQSLVAGNTYTIYDPGGTGYYSNNCQSTLYLTAPTGYVILLSGTSNTETNCDYLRIYDAASAMSSALIGTYTGVGQNVNNITSSQYATIQFTSDGSVTNQGYVITVSLVPVSPDVDDNSGDSGDVQIISTEGTSFWLTFLRNHQTTTVPTLSLLISSRQSGSVTISNPNTGWSTTAAFSANTTTTVTIPNQQGLCTNYNVVANTGIHVVSTTPISLYSSNYFSYTFDAANILPDTTLSTDYIIQSYTTANSSSPEEAVVVATENNTTVQINNTTVTLNRGKTYMFSGINMSGTTIHADKKVAVFNGNTCANVPSNCGYCDHIYEQSIPINMWGKEFALTKTAGRNYDRIKVTALSDSTVVTCNGNLISTLSAHTTTEFALTSNSAFLTASKPVACYLYVAGSGSNSDSQGDPSMVWMSPIEQRINQITFSTLNATICSSHYVNIVTPTEGANDMRIDGNAISGFATLNGNPSYSYRVLQISTGSHTLSNATSGFVAHVYGLGRDESYAYNVGSRMEIINNFDITGEENEVTYDTNFMSEIICNGGYYLFHGDTLRFAGTYYDTTIVSASMFEIDVLSLSVRPTIDTIISAQICSGTNYTLNGFSEDASGEYTHYFVDQYGCDSTVRLNLTVLPTYDTTLHDRICAGENYFDNGFSESVSGVYVHHLSTIGGCDSTVSLHLSVIEPVVTNVQEEIVQNQTPWSFGGRSYTMSINNDTIHYVSSLGCDSIVDYTLLVWMNVQTMKDSTLCENNLPLLWNGKVISASGIDTVKYLRTNGADSVVVMNFTKLVNTYDTVNRTIIENNLPDLYAGFSFGTDVADSTLLLVNAAGCDSLINYSLTVYRNHTIVVDSSLCENMLPIVWNGVTFNQTHTDTVTLHDQYGADSVVVMNFTKLVNTYDTINATIIENMLPASFLGVDFPTDIADTTFLLVNGAGCDSLVNYNLTVYRNHFVVVDSSLCENALPIVWNGVTFAQTHSDTVLLHDRFGADSTVAMNLTKLVNTYDTVAHVVLENNLPDMYAGFSFDTDVADSTLTFVNAAGCDSLIHYSLTVRWNTTTIVDSSLCENMLPIVWNGVTFNQTHTDTVTLHDQFGADSVVVMNFTKLVNTYDTINATIIENMLPASFLGVDFPTDIADTTFLLVNGAGCDSLVNYNLTVFRNDTTEVDSSLCQVFFPLVWNGVTFLGTATDTAVLHTIHGADSVVIMHVSQFANDFGTTHRYVVENDLPFVYGTYSFSADVDDSTLFIQTPGQCDSVITFSLTIYPNQSTLLDSTICASSLPLDWNGAHFSAAGTQSVVFQGSHAVDSVVTMTLHVNPIFYEERPVEICDDTSYAVGNQHFQASGDWTVNMSTIHQCDSTVLLHLAVHPTYHILLDEDICQEQSYQVGGQDFAQTGDYEVPLISAHGCDSLVSLHLDVHPIFTVQVDSVNCEDGFVIYNGEYFNQSGMYIQNLHTVNRCDSVVYLNLFIETPPHAEIRAEPSRADFDNRVIRLSAKGHGVYNKWIVDGEELSDEALFYYDYPDDTDSVIVQLVSLSANGCADTDWVVIPFVKAIVWAPNVFTPGEASNNQFCVYEDEMTEGHVWLYTRQGVYVTDFDAMTECWDGRFKGQIAPQNSYVWILRYHTKVDPQIELVKKGTVTLLH